MRVRWPVRIATKHRGALQFLALVVLGTIYCLVLGSYAVIHQPSLTRQNASHVKPKPQLTPAPGEPEEDAVDLVSLEAELEARRARVWNVCVEHDLHSSGRPNAWEFFIDSTHGLVWCNIFKAASSTWMYNFNVLGGYKEQFLRRTRKALLVLARAHYPRPTVEQLRTALPESLSFLIVREPFERLLSAFRNKLEGFRHRFYRKLGREMIAKYRNKSDPLPVTAGPTFSEFVSYVADVGQSKSAKFDEHWAPFYSFCTPCLVNFTVIAKLETLSRDQEYVIRRAGLENILMYPRYKDKPKRIMNKARDGKNTKDLTEKYYSQLTETQLKRLYQIYYIDFEMFGYNVSRYFNMVRHTDS